MPDITMCSNDACPLAKDCYRHEAVPWAGQSWFLVDPTPTRTINAAQEVSWDCDNFLRIHRKEKP